MDLGSYQRLDREAGLLQHAAHDVLAALVQLHLDQRLALPHVHDLHAVGACNAIVQLHAVLQLADQLAARLAQHGGHVGLLHLVLGVHQAVGQLAVVGEQQQAFGLGIQAADVEQPLAFLQARTHQVANARTAQVVAHRGVHTAGLVQCEVDHLFVDLHALAVHADDVHARVDAGAHLHHDFAVYFHATGGDELLAHAAACHTRRGQHFLQAHLGLLRIWFVEGGLCLLRRHVLALGGLGLG